MKPNTDIHFSGDISDWNYNKACFEGKTLSWDERDHYQRLLIVFQSDAIDAVNTILEYEYVLGFTSEHLPFVNKSPQFWSEVTISLRFSLIMKTARLFDESKDAIGLIKVFNILEQSPYGRAVADELITSRRKYAEYKKYIEEIRTLRDKLYAHNDKKEYQFWNNPKEMDLEFEGSFWTKIKEMVRWVSTSLLRIRELIGDGYPANKEITNDLSGLLPEEK